MKASTFGLLFVLFVVILFNQFVLVPMGYNLVDLIREVL